MHTHTDKTQEKSQAAANNLPKLKTGRGSAFQVVDNRPETIAQRKLQDRVNNSSLMSRLSVLQKMANQPDAGQRFTQQISVIQMRRPDGTASAAGELIQDIRNGDCFLEKSEQFQTRQDKDEDTISEEYLVKYKAGAVLYIHIHNSDGDQSVMIHVKDTPYGNSLFSLGNSWAKFLAVAHLAGPFGI